MMWTQVNGKYLNKQEVGYRMDLGIAIRRWFFFFLSFINPVVDIAEGTGWSN